MRRAWRVFALTVLALGVTALPCAVQAAEKPPEVLEQEYQSQKNPRKRADIARELMTIRLQQLREFIGTGTMLSDSSEEVTNYQAALDKLASAVREAQHTGTSKKVETFLRTQMNGLEDLKLAVSGVERPMLEELLANVTALREETLYSIMHPPEKK